MQNNHIWFLLFKEKLIVFFTIHLIIAKADSHFLVAITSSEYWDSDILKKITFSLLENILIQKQLRQEKLLGSIGFCAVMNLVSIVQFEKVRAHLWKSTKTGGNETQF